MAKKTRKKVVRKKVVRKKKKPAARMRTLNLRKVKADLDRAIKAMRRRGAPEPAETRLRQALDELNQFCSVEQGCGTTMIIPL